VTDVTDYAYATGLLDMPSKRVDLGDGAMCTQPQGAADPAPKHVRLQSG
jgi:hypothetical protein